MSRLGVPQKRKDYSTHDLIHKPEAIIYICLVPMTLPKALTTSSTLECLAQCHAAPVTAEPFERAISQTFCDLAY